MATVPEVNITDSQREYLQAVTDPELLNLQLTSERTYGPQFDTISLARTQTILFGINDPTESVAYLTQSASVQQMEDMLANGGNPLPEDQVRENASTRYESIAGPKPPATRVQYSVTTGSRATRADQNRKVVDNSAAVERWERDRDAAIAQALEDNANSVNLQERITAAKENLTQIEDQQQAGLIEMADSAAQAAADTQNKVNDALRRGDIDSLKALGAETTQALRDADPQTKNIVEASLQIAERATSALEADQEISTERQQLQNIANSQTARIQELQALPITSLTQAQQTELANLNTQRETTLARARQLEQASNQAITEAAGVQGLRDLQAARGERVGSLQDLANEDLLAAGRAGNPLRDARSRTNEAQTLSNIIYNEARALGGSATDRTNLEQFINPNTLALEQLATEAGQRDASNFASLRDLAGTTDLATQAQQLASTEIPTNQARAQALIRGQLNNAQLRAVNLSQLGDPSNAQQAQIDRLTQDPGINASLGGGLAAQQRLEDLQNIQTRGANLYGANTSSSLAALRGDSDLARTLAENQIARGGTLAQQATQTNFDPTGSVFRYRSLADNVSEQAKQLAADAQGPLSAERRRMAEQAARQRAAQTGRLGDQATLATELLNREESRAALRAEAREAARLGVDLQAVFSDRALGAQEQARLDAIAMEQAGLGAQQQAFAQQAALEQAILDENRSRRGEATEMEMDALTEQDAQTRARNTQVLERQIASANERAQREAQIQDLSTQLISQGLDAATAATQAEATINQQRIGFESDIVDQSLERQRLGLDAELAARQLGFEQTQAAEQAIADEARLLRAEEQDLLQSNLARTDRLRELGVEASIATGQAQADIQQRIFDEERARRGELTTAENTALTNQQAILEAELAQRQLDDARQESLRADELAQRQLGAQITGMQLDAATTAAQFDTEEARKRRAEIAGAEQTAFSSQGQLAEMDSAQQQNLFNQAVTGQQLAFGQSQATGGDPAAVILGRSSQAGAQGTGVALGAPGVSQAYAPLFDPGVGTNIEMQNIANQVGLENAQLQADAARSAGRTSACGSIAGAIIGLCWVAREVYGEANPKWFKFREWMLSKAPRWFLKLYIKYGERFAEFISNKPMLKSIIRKWMDSKI